MKKKESINEFLKQKKIAIAGVSGNTKKFGYAVFRDLKKAGYDICPINPNRGDIDGVQCFKSVNEIPAGYDKLLIVTSKSKTDVVLKEAIDRGIKHVWVQQASGTKETRKIAVENDVNLIDKECIFMFAEPVTGPHKFHRAIWKLFGLYPK